MDQNIAHVEYWWYVVEYRTVNANNLQWQSLFK